MNLKAIKNYGYQLGLEAELNAQRLRMVKYIEDKKYSEAMQCNKNIGELLSELTFIVDATKVLSEVKE